MEIIKVCPICKALDFKIVGTNSKFGYLSNINCCNMCNTMFLEKQLSDVELSTFYKKEYRNRKNEKLASNQLMMAKEMAISQFDFYKEYVLKNSDLLEIGAGLGVHANLLFDKKKYNIFVSEYDDCIKSVLYPEIQILNFDFKKETKNFDFIILCHVLEHLPNLEEKLEFLLGCLNDNGCIFIEVPNCENNAVKQMSKESFHYWFFNLKGILYLLIRKGYSIIKYGAYGKEKYFEELSNEELVKWKCKVNTAKASFIELSPRNKKAFYLRVLAKKA